MDDADIIRILKELLTPQEPTGWSKKVFLEAVRTDTSIEILPEWAQVTAQERATRYAHAITVRGSFSLDPLMAADKVVTDIVLAFDAGTLERVVRQEPMCLTR